MKKTYFFGKGTPFRQDRAQVIGEFLEQFPDLTPQKVVDLAKDPTTPLHAEFEWDVQKAAERHWVAHAGKLVRSLYIKIEGAEVRAYENVFLKIQDHSAYVNTQEVFSTEELWVQVIEEAKRSLLFWEQKYILYKDKLPTIFSAIEKLKEEQAYGEGQKDRDHRNGRSDSRTGDRP